ncbi:SipW-dependent-type signal peptide-containing protein [Halorubrum saccharovorum]|uniref:DUF7467 domain-containing protein n=1 Tax=Halorubrum saccharovorum TaxID=2248 RepID=UPI0006787945|nr:SipW-dependent-type signal peptide-containing protein [Halorubrum saccharovorum]
MGAVGAASGAGTFAYFTDEESFPDNTLGAGKVDVVVDCHGCLTDDDGRVRFDLVGDGSSDTLDRGDHGTERLSVSVQTNPARLWLGTDCPPAPDPLGDAVRAELTVGTRSVSGSLAGIRRELVTGLRIDDADGSPCLDPSDDSLEIVLDWELPQTTPQSVEGESTSFDFQVYAEQCRHVPEIDAERSNPFAGAARCPDPCVVCADDTDTKVGSLTLKYLGSETGDIVVTGRGGPQAKDGTVVFSGSVDGGDSFLIEGGDADDGRLPRNLYVDDSGATGVAGAKIHTSCSVPLAVGDVFPERDPLYEVAAATTIDGEPICASTEEGDGDDHPDEDENDEDGDDDRDDGPDCGVCGDGNGRLRDLTFRYLGDANATIEVTTTQTGPSTGATVFGPADRGGGDVFVADGAGVAQTHDGGFDGLGQNTTVAIVDGGDAGVSTEVDIHTSCSDPIAVGNTYGTDDDGGPLYEVVAGTTTRDGPLCVPEDI